MAVLVEVPVFRGAVGVDFAVGADLGDGRKVERMRSSQPGVVLDRSAR